MPKEFYFHNILEEVEEWKQGVEVDLNDLGKGQTVL